MHPTWGVLLCAGVFAVGLLLGHFIYWHPDRAPWAAASAPGLRRALAVLPPLSSLPAADSAPAPAAGQPQPRAPPRAPVPAPAPAATPAAAPAATPAAAPPGPPPAPPAPPAAGAGSCNASTLPRWMTEARSHTGVNFRDASPAWPAPCPEGRMPDSLKVYSQYGQEARAIERYFWGVTGGKFIELGAHDGLRMSNSKALEDHLGWTGLLIEANPSMYVQAERWRPRAAVAHAACGPSWSREGVALVLGGGGETSHLRQLPGKAGPRQRKIVAQQPLVSIAALTERWGCGRPLHVDFMSLDVEGAELMVMQGFDWQRVTIGVMLVETAWLSKDQRSALEALLLSAGGLRNAGGEGADTWYVSPHGAERRRAKPNGTELRLVPMGGVVRPRRGRRGRGGGRFVVCWKEGWARPQYSKCL
eukprot:TRINITY_DN18743_c0_g1_i2.p1 TRINITY_DN18743_c0_g1~~TRINITY_DN18743_c0_g1_i2.p1  ORF type:complete len:441 (+),score=120.26 TRINITY_DN18743_c0_g1_i2:70-1323(+)